MLSLAAMLTALSACGGPADSAGALLAIVPASAEVGPGETLKFETNPDESVGWEVLEVDGGVIDPTGVYTAPEAEGTYTVAALSISGQQTTSIRVKRNVRVEVLPSAATVPASASVALIASVNASNKAVTWSVAEGAAGGTVSSAGVYTAPATAGTYNVVATSVADPSRSDRASITVTAPQSPAPAVGVAVSPQTASVLTGASVQLTASVTGTTDAAVTWSVASGTGTVSATGLYTAPATPGSYQVTATSRADATKSASATITVSAPQVSKPVISGFSASPSSITQGASATLSWSVSGETSLTLSDVGAVTGLSSRSVAPSATTTYTLTATNAAGSVTATTTVNVTPAPTPTPTPTPTPSTGDIGACTALVSHSNAVPTSPLARPGYLQAVIDPDFKTRIVRVTGDAGTAIANPFNDPSLVGKAWAAEPAGPTYAKETHWNADGTLLVVKRGAPGNLFLDGNTYQPRFQRSRGRSSYADWRWHPKNPALGIYVKPNGEVGLWDVRADTETMKLAGQGFSGCRLGNGEGNVSDDGRFLVVQCGTSFYAVDLGTSLTAPGVKYPTITAAALGYGSLDWASISPKGTRVIASKDNTLNKSAPLSLSMTASQFGAAFSSGHYDVGLAPDGSEVAYESGVPKVVNLATGAVTSIGTPVGAGQYHGSTRNTAATGWGYGSLESTRGNMVGEIVAHELKAGGRIRRLAHHRTSLTSGANGVEPSYEHMAFGVASTDGKQVFFRSDWGNGAGAVHGYVVDTRNLCP